MNKISNSFVSLEYDSLEQEKLARYYMDIINAEPKYFKSILMGINTINIKEAELPEISHDKHVNRMHIIEYILVKNNAKNTQCSYYWDTPTLEEIYYNITEYILNNPNPRKMRYIYHDMAYDYLIMTGDFSYLEKFYFKYDILDDIDDDDMEYLVKYKIEHCYEDLLKIKIDKAKLSSYYPLIRDNMIDIMKIAMDMRIIANGEIDINKNLGKKPEINHKTFEKLVVGALAYIDPTNGLVEEYLEANKEGRIKLHPAEKGNISECHHYVDIISGELTNWDIDLYMDGTIEDVKDLVHELAHHHYFKNDESIRENNVLFAEYPSIYFEYKTLEYLEQVGYTKEEIMPIKINRMKTNQRNINHHYPSLFTIHVNSFEKDGEYNIEPVKRYVESNWQREFRREVETSSPRSRKRLLNRIEYLNKTRTLSTIENDVALFEYVIGTYFTLKAIENLSHEDTLRVLEYIQNNKVDFAKMKELHGLSEGIKQNTSNKVKQKQV